MNTSTRWSAPRDRWRKVIRSTFAFFGVVMVTGPLASSALAQIPGYHQVPGQQLSLWVSRSEAYSLVEGQVDRVSLFSTKEGFGKCWSARIRVARWHVGQGPEEVWIIGNAVNAIRDGERVLLEIPVTTGWPFTPEGSRGLFLLKQSQNYAFTVERSDVPGSPNAALIEAAWLETMASGVWTIPTKLDVRGFPASGLARQRDDLDLSRTVRVSGEVVQMQTEEIASAITAWECNRGWLYWAGGELLE